MLTWNGFSLLPNADLHSHDLHQPYQRPCSQKLELIMLPSQVLFLQGYLVIVEGENFMLVWFINYVNNRVMRAGSLQATLRLKERDNAFFF
jgi:hypothetical protein